MKKIFCSLVFLWFTLNANNIPNPATIGLIYSGNISAAQLEDMMLKLRYDFRLPTRTLYPYTTINSGGFYQLADNVTNNAITISASNVMLDMNGCTVSGATNGIVINSGLSNVTVRNGTVSGTSSDAITVGAGCTDITLDGITVLNATTARGIFLNQVTNGIVSNCDMIGNTTGCELSICHNVQLSNCIALANVQAGFSLITSTTCSCFDCNALSTGQGFTNQNGNVFGFVSQSGTGNIFERCIANATQGLTITGGQSIVAGFGLRSTESLSSIISCEAGNAVTNPSSGGVTLPYGIWLENTLATTLTLTATPPIPNPTAQVNGIDWTSDGQYLAVGSNSADTAQLRVYQYDRVLQLLDQVATATLTIGANVNDVIWSPDAGFLAAGTAAATNPLRIYQFNRLNNTLNQLGNPLPNAGASVTDVAWSPNSLYLATGTATTLSVYSFNKTANTATRVATASVASITGVDFSSDSKYIAVSFGNSVQIYQFSVTGNALTTFTAAVTVTGATSVYFSPDNNYLAVSSSNGASSKVTILQFNVKAATLTAVSSVTFAAAINDVDWSPDGLSLVSGGARITTFRFDRGSNSLIQAASVVNGGATTYNSVRFSPDGKYVAAGSTGGSLFFTMYQAMIFPTGNTIMNNTVYCNSGDQFVEGIGISGSSIDNMIIGNVAYNNLLNYAFVCNVFNQLFGDAPTKLQNIAGGVNNIIQTPIDLPTSLGRIQVLAQSLVDILI